jgi:hypothetical protein
MNYITFTKKKNDIKKIIDEVEQNKSINTMIKDGVNSFISIIKPLFLSDGN